MGTPKKTAKGARKAAKAPADETGDETASLFLRGLTPEDMTAIDRAVERRRSMIGGAFVSKNSTVLAVLRAALAREDAEATKGAAT